MKLKSVEIDNYRAIEHLRLPLDPALTVLHGDNTCGKTSVLSAIAVGLGAIPELLSGVSAIEFLDTDLRVGESFVQVELTTTEEDSWKRERSLEKKTDYGLDVLRAKLPDITRASEEAGSPVALPIVVFYDTNRVALAPDVVHAPDRGPVFLAVADPFGSKERRYAMLAAEEEMIARIGRNRDSSRNLALHGALSARTSFPELFTWFYAKENDELRDQKQRHISVIDGRTCLRSAMQSSRWSMGFPSLTSTWILYDSRSRRRCRKAARRRLNSTS